MATAIIEAGEHTVEIPSEYAAKFYEMDPDYEEVKWGNQLKEGDVVLIEASTMREDPERRELMNGYELERLLTCNLWCKITNVRHQDRHDLISFVGVYADGTQKPRTYGHGHAWIVKRETSQRNDDQARKRKRTFRR